MHDPRDAAGGHVDRRGQLQRHWAPVLSQREQVQAGGVDLHPFARQLRHRRGERRCGPVVLVALPPQRRRQVLDLDPELLQQRVERGRRRQHRLEAVGEPALQRTAQPLVQPHTVAHRLLAPARPLHQRHHQVHHPLVGPPQLAADPGAPVVHQPPQALPQPGAPLALHRGRRRPAPPHRLQLLGLRRVTLRQRAAGRVELGPRRARIRHTGVAAGVHLDDVALPVPGHLHRLGADRLQPAQRGQHRAGRRRAQDLEPGGSHQMVQPHQRALPGRRRTALRVSSLGAVRPCQRQQPHRVPVHLHHLVHATAPPHPAAQRDPGVLSAPRQRLRVHRPPPAATTTLVGNSGLSQSNRSRWDHTRW